MFARITKTILILSVAAFLITGACSLGSAIDNIANAQIANGSVGVAGSMNGVK